jgi:anti-sigma regulatory factor (Ser/Thr protein kinase)
MPPLPSSDKLAAAPAAAVPATLTSENSMTGHGPSSPEPRLTLKSQLEDLTRVWPWVEAIAARYSVPPDTQFAIQLCLEEALSNIIRHGYQGQADQPISIACTVECAPAAVENEHAAELVFTVEDHAPPFDPLARSAAPAPAPASLQELQPSGRGIRLMRKFAGRLTWQQLPNGNRLTMGFVLTR